MSRIGKKEITLPSDVSVKVEGTKVTVSGPKGTLSQNVDRNIIVKVDGNTVSLTRLNELNETKAKHGLYRSLINNMVEGVTKGFSKKLVVNGVGFKVSMQGKKLVMNLGFSHPVEMEQPEGITIQTPSATEIVVSGIDKQAVGQIAAQIRDLRPVEPYHGYGIKYDDEVVIRKVGKTSGKGKK